MAGGIHGRGRGRAPESRFGTGSSIHRGVVIHFHSRTADVGSIVTCMLCGMTVSNTPPEDRRPDQAPHELAARDEEQLLDEGDPPTVRIGDVDELQRSIPHLIGFHPDRSVIALGLRGASRQLRVAVRVDVPLTAAEAFETGVRLGEVLVRAGSQDAVVTYYDHGCAFGDDAVAAETELCFERTRGMQLELGGGMSIGGVRARFAWPAQAVPAPAPPTALEVAAITQGRPAYRSRGDVQELLHPVGGSVRAEVAAVLDEIGPVGLASWELVRSVCELLEHRADARRGEGGVPRSAPPDLALCALAASNVHSRDVLLSLMATDDDLLNLDLWLEVTRCAPTRYVAGAATVAALCAYLKGDGVVAGCAVDCALNADPDHRLAGLVDSSLSGGIPPEDVRSLLASTMIPEPKCDDQ